MWISVIVAFRAVTTMLALGEDAGAIENRVVATATIIGVAWWLVRVVAAVANAIERSSHANTSTSAVAPDARGVRTQVRVMRRVLNVAIALLAIALVLTQFEVVRSVGVSLLASAGIAGVVLGLAAQKTLAGIFAGIHLTATQPIRIGDVVIVDGQWGTIEEVTLTYVVLKIWDERRLIVPMSRFLDQPFENWTRTSVQLHGTVFLFADWTMPVDEMRRAVDRAVIGHPKWDGRTKSVLVTDVKEHTLQVRVLVSARNADDLWSLRVDLREKLVRWLQENESGRWLPRLRVGDSTSPSIAGPAALTTLSS